MSKRSPEDILRDIQESDLEEAADKALSMTADERRAALKGAGVDLVDLQTKADALHERMQRAATEQGVRKLEAEARKQALVPPPRRSRVLLRLAAVAVAAIIVALLLRARRESEQAPVASPSATLPPTALPGASTPAPTPTPTPTPAPAPAPTPTPTPTRDAAPFAPDKPPFR